MSHDYAALSRRWFAEVWNKRRPEAVDELMRPDTLSHSLDSAGDMRGPEAFKRFQAQFLGAFPDLHIVVEEVIVEGDRTAIRFTCTGTHGGDHLGMPSTGRRVRFGGMSMVHWKDGRIAEGWNNVDFGGMMNQIAAEETRG